MNQKIDATNRHLFAYIPDDKEIEQAFRTLPYAEYVQYTDAEGKFITCQRESWLKNG